MKLARFSIHPAPLHRYRSSADAPALADIPPPAFPLPDETGDELATLIPPGAIGLYPSTAGLNLAVTFYAWRSLLPIAGPEDASPTSIARAAGLESAPYLLLSTSPPPEVTEQTADLRAALAPGDTPFETGVRWESTRLP